jgi:hypothetical protein
MFAMTEAQANDTTQEDIFGDRTIYLIPEANFPRFEREIEKLSRRSEKLIGLPIRPVVFGRQHKEISKGVTVLMIETYLVAETPKIEGWTFVARIDHTNDAGNIIRTVPNLSCDLPEHFRTAKPDCQHCNVRRLRRDTFVIRNDQTGEYQQVGTSCLKDFFGHDPYKIAKLAELLGYANEVGQSATTGIEASLTDRRWVNLEELLESTAAAIRLNGWTSVASSKETGRTPTRELAFNGLGQETTEEDQALAQRALAWARTLSDKDNRSDYEHNVSVIAEAVYIEHRSIGIAASIVGVFYQNERRASGNGEAANVGDLSGLIALIDRAKQSGLKAPKIALQLPNGMPLRLNVAGPSAAQPGTINITDGGSYGNNVWYGRVNREGKFTPSRFVNDANRPSIIALLAAMAVDPARTATQYGRLTGQCCFCSRPLNDERSTDVGYGPVCARNFGLVWG